MKDSKSKREQGIYTAVIGELVVNLKAMTAEFTDSLGKSNTLLVEFGQNGEKAGKVVNTSMREATGGLMMAEHVLGVPLPRHLNRLIAQIPGVGAAFATMLPIIGAVLAVEILEKLITKHEEAAQKIRDTALAAGELAMKEEDQSHSMELANLKLEDQIAKLEGRPGTNRLKESLLETAKEASTLSKEFETDFKSIDKAVNSAQGPMVVFMQSLRDAGAILGASSFADMAEKWSKGSDAVEDLGAQLAAVSHQADHIRALEMKPKSYLADGQIADANALSAAYEQQAKYLTTAKTAAENMPDPDQELIGQLKNGVVVSVQAEHDKQDQIKNIRLRAEADALNDRKDAAGRAEAADKAASAAYQAKVKAEWDEDTWLDNEQKNLDKESERAEEEALATKISSLKAGQAQMDAIFADKQKQADKWIADKKKADGKELAEERKFQAEHLRIVQKAEEESEKVTRQCEEKMADEASKNTMKSIFAHKSLATAFKETGEEMLLTLMQNVAKAIIIHNTEKMDAARTAGSKAYEWASGSGPIVANIVGMLAMANCLAFAQGGKVPGSGNTDSVNAMLMPGETVVSKALTQQVEQSQGGGSQGSTIQHNPTYHVSMIDASGVRGMLKQHDAEFQRHAVQTMRKMNTRIGRG